MKNTNRITDEELTLLAEGELSPEYRELVFQRLDLDPTGWKRCAMALLHSQALSASLSQLSFDTHPAGSEAATTNEPKAKPDLVHPANKEGSFSKADKNTRGAWAGKMMPSSPVTVAFLIGFILIGFGGGWFLKPKIENRDSNRVGRIDSNPETTNAQTAEISSEMERQLERLTRSVERNEFELVAFVGIEERGQTQIIPMIRSEKLQKQIVQMPAPPLPSKVNRRLLKSGWQIQANRHFVSVDLPNGKTQMVPISLLTYRFVGKETL